MHSGILYLLMQNLDRGIDTFLNKGKRPTSERAYLIQSICDTLFDDSDFKKILGQTRQFTTEEIRHLFDQARSWKVNPQAFFWKLIREKQEEIKQQINNKPNP